MKNLMVRGSVATLALAILGSGAAFAQSTAPGADSAAENKGGVDEIVVTAQRRAESLQEVPISVATLTADQLGDAGVLRTDALVQLTPGLVITRQLAGATTYLRGVGSQSTQPGVENPVATYIDGVYFPSATGNIFSFNNVQQVEVLRGPQGTLFGRNANGGLISITTRAPSGEESVEGSIGYGNYNTVTGNLYMTGGSDTLAGDIAIYGAEQGEGFGVNLVTGDDVNRVREVAVRTKLQWTATPDDVFTVAANAGGIGDSRNAQLLAGLQTANTMNGGTASYQGAYSQLVSEIGNKTRELDVTSSAAGKLFTEAKLTLESESGVNLDEEGTNLLRYQQAYQAAGKVMQIASQMFDVLLSLGN